MSNEVPEFVDIQITSEYGYRPDELVTRFQELALNTQVLFESTDFMTSELELIGQEFVTTAKKFAIEQGLGGGGTSLLAWGSSPKNKFGTVTGPPQLNGIVPAKGPTGNLVKSIKYEITNNRNISFYNDAQNSREQYYAGHIEYGFHDRGGNMIPARPFMRPALYAVADASRGRIIGTMKRYLEAMWAMESLQFGYPVTPKGNYRAFYEKHDSPKDKGFGRYTSSKLPQGRLQQLRSREGREKFTVDRKGSEKYRGYTQRLSSKMGSKKGWYKDSEGHEKSKRDTRWIKPSNERNFVKSSSRTSTSTKPISPYGSKGDYQNFKHFADTHFNGSLREAKGHWKKMS